MVRVIHKGRPHKEEWVVKTGWGEGVEDKFGRPQNLKNCQIEENLLNLFIK